MARAAGARTIAIDVVPEKLEAARRLGADETMMEGSPDTAKALRKATAGGPDVVFEVIGNPKTIRTAVDAVRPGGRVVVVGYSEKDATLPAGRIMFRELEVRGSLGCPLQDFPRVLALAARGAFDLKAMVTHRFPLDDINEGFAQLEGGAPDMVRGIALPRS